MGLDSATLATITSGTNHLLVTCPPFFRNTQYSYSYLPTDVMRASDRLLSFFGIERMLIDPPIVYGNSGGPVLN